MSTIQLEATWLAVLENEGVALRVRWGGQRGWCNRRLLARIQRATLRKLRREIEPVSSEVFWRFLAAWQHATPERRLEGPEGTFQVIRQLAGDRRHAAQRAGPAVNDDDLRSRSSVPTRLHHVIIRKACEGLRHRAGRHRSACA